jgi:hypothetical protein
MKGSIFAISVLLLVIITGSGCVHSNWASQEPQPPETEPTPAPEQAPLTNSDNASEEELSPEDELMARLAQRTYLSAEEFGITALTEQEKADCIAIASQHPAVSGFIENGQEYITVFRWIGLLPSGGYGLLHYDVVEKGIPSVLDWPKRATFFPAVGFRTATYSYVLAIDLDTREVVYVTSGPIR